MVVLDLVRFGGRTWPGRRAWQDGRGECRPRMPAKGRGSMNLAIASLAHILRQHSARKQGIENEDGSSNGVQPRTGKHDFKRQPQRQLRSCDTLQLLPYDEDGREMESRTPSTSGK